jgi:hypothetical protein
MTTGGWLITLLVLAIPFVNVIMYIVWAINGGNRSRTTFCRASILWFFLILGLMVGIQLLGLASLPLITELLERSSQS